MTAPESPDRPPGPHLGIPSTDRRTTGWDFLSWTRWDRFWNRVRFFDRWHVPKVEAAHRNLERGLAAGATLVFAHCGLPYFAAGGLLFKSEPPCPEM